MAGCAACAVAICSRTPLELFWHLMKPAGSATAEC